MGFLAVDLDPLLTCTEGDDPITAHLQAIIERFQRMMIESVLCPFEFACPDQGFMRVGKTHSTKVRHWVALDPDHIVENPESQILHQLAEAKDVMIGANNPQRAAILQHPPTGAQPALTELVISLETFEAIPSLSNTFHSGHIRPP